MSVPLRRTCVRVLLLVVLAGPVAALAAMPTLSDCLEGADFIGNAARSRDNGMSRAAFIGRLEDDLVVIRAFPPALRWFARDAADERFLLEAAARVFDRPRAAAEHHADFLAMCLERVGA